MLEYGKAPAEFDTLPDPALARKADKFIEDCDDEELSAWVQYYKEMIFSAVFGEAETGRRAIGNILANYSRPRIGVQGQLDE